VRFGPGDGIDEILRGHRFCLEVSAKAETVAGLALESKLNRTLEHSCGHANRGAKTTI
jgi:hypothetical protein